VPLWRIAKSVAELPRSSSASAGRPATPLHHHLRCWRRKATRVPDPVVLIDKLDGTGQRALKQPRKLRGIGVGTNSSRMHRFVRERPPEPARRLTFEVLVGPRESLGSPVRQSVKLRNLRGALDADRAAVDPRPLPRRRGAGSAAYGWQRKGCSKEPRERRRPLSSGGASRDRSPPKRGASDSR
jgi:hypothetical protein